MRARLALVDGDARPNTVDLAPEQPISIGRSRDNTVVLPHEEQASRLHARLYFENGRWLLRDFGLNGTRVDDARVNQIAELAHGNEIRIGSVRLKFQVPEPTAAPAGPAQTVSDRAAAETLAGGSPGPRWTVDELSAMNQFLGSAIESRDATELARTAIQSLLYQTGAAMVGYFNLDPSNPVPKLIWPESAKPDESLARQLTRRMHRDHRLIWLAEDTAVTLPNMSGSFNTSVADVLAIPLRSGKRTFGAFHLYKSNGYFSEHDRKFAETLAGHAAKIFRWLRSRRALEADTIRLRSALPDGDELVGDSPPMVALRTELARAAASPRPFLIRGEPGSGKKLAAREAHRRGPRADSPFVVVRLSATPTSLLEAEIFGYRKGAFSGADKDLPGHVAQADEGTLFIDEIADLPPACQTRLVQLIESHTYRPLGATYDSQADVKIIAASRKDLAAEVSAGRFRPELLSAIQKIEVVVPPLRNHADDIQHLSQFFLDRICAEYRHEWLLTPQAVQLLRRQQWPGNVRQLRSVLSHAASVAASDNITESDLQPLLGQSRG
jgi:hypothetical protein